MTPVSESIISDEAEEQKNRAMGIGGGNATPNSADKGADKVVRDDPNVLLGRLAIHYKVLTMDKVEFALEAWQAEAGQQDFGAFLIAKNYQAPKTLGQLIRARDRYLQQRPGAADSGPAQASKPPLSAVPVTNVPEPMLAVAPGSAAISGLEPKPTRKFAEVTRGIVKPVASPEIADKAKDQGNEPDLLSYGPGVTLQSLLQQAIELNASDLHVHSRDRLRIRINGEIRDATSAILTSRECESLIKDVLSEPQRKILEEKFQLDFAYDIPGIGRFRANAYQQRRGIDAVFRTIKPQPPTLAELGLPQELERFTKLHQGLVLFTGPAGCGKSSTMAAMVNLVNKNRTDHILTIEDPIEYVHPSISCSVNQRETGVHTASFSKALRAALREDPDVIVIGELRDYETISLAVTAAETGHLVMGTLHTSNAIRTVNRLLGVFPPDQQAQIRMMLSESLKVVVSQRLAYRADDRGRIPALEVMINNNAIGNLIRENRTFQIKSIMQTGGAQGQCLLDASLASLLKRGVITSKEAIRYAEQPENFN